MFRRAMLCTLFTIGMASAAHASPCTAQQEQELGKLTINLVRSKVSELPPVEGKQLINLKSCDARAGRFNVDFRYNFTGSGGLYWVEGEASLDNSGAGDVRPKRSSDNLRLASVGG